ncbi:ester cyclase [Nocardia sp. CA-128927]|uniref:ester cyclase n=1 Tax=Nocardia sp. CA-128927 TaxID=3239975 RepID=UPI003D98C26E
MDSPFARYEEKLMSSDQETNNTAIFRRFHDIVNTDDLEAISQTIHEVVAPEALLHTPLPITATGAEALEHVWAMLLQAFPDIHVAVEDLIAKGDRVVCRSVVTGTHKGDFHGLAPTGNSVTYNEVFFLRFANNRITEIWGLVDTLTLRQQLGLIPA